MYTIYLYILTAMVFAAFFSGVETAFASASKMRFQLDTHRQGLISKLTAAGYAGPLIIEQYAGDYASMDEVAGSVEYIKNIIGGKKC